MMGEAGGASREFQQGVANVIRNRATILGGTDANYGSVINQPGAFSAMTDPRTARLVQGGLNGTNVTQSVREVVEGVYGGTMSDNTDGALLYYSPVSMTTAGSDGRQVQCITCKPRWNFSTLQRTLYTTSPAGATGGQTTIGTEGIFYKCKEGNSCWAPPRQ